MGPPVLINETWYKLNILQRCQFTPTVAQVSARAGLNDILKQIVTVSLLQQCLDGLRPTGDRTSSEVVDVAKRRMALLGGLRFIPAQTMGGVSPFRRQETCSTDASAVRCRLGF
jgi:hypothetical protein